MRDHHPDKPPADLVITEGPFANVTGEDPVSARKRQALSNYAREPERIQCGEGRVSPDAKKVAEAVPAPRPAQGAGAVVTQAGVTPRVAQGAVVKQAAVDSAMPDYDMNQAPNSAAISGSANRAGTAPVKGSDIGQLPGPSMTPMTISSGPTSGKRGPATADARTLSGKIMAGLAGKRGKVPGVPLPPARAPTGQDVKANGDNPTNTIPNDGKDRSSMVLSSNEGPTFYSGTNREKIGFTLKAIGAPLSLVTEDSVLWQASAAKVASVQSSGGDDAVEYIARDDTHPLALATFLTSRFSPAWEDWDLETVKDMLVDLGREPSTSTMNKIAALQLAHKKPSAFYTDWFTFEKMCLAFDGTPPRLTLVVDLSPEQMAMGASVMRMLTMPSQSPIAFAPDLEAYVAARLFDAGLVVAPPELGFADAKLQALVGADAGDLRKRTLGLYALALKGKEPKGGDNQDPPADDFVQAGRLMRIHAYVLDRVDDLVRQAG